MLKARFNYVIIGGGIAGISCAECLSQLCPETPILLLTASPLIKTVTNVRKVTQRLDDFDVEERPMFELKAQCPNVVVDQQVIEAIDSEKKRAILSNGDWYCYEKLCICTGAYPKVIAKDHPYVLGIRDTDTVKEFQLRLKNARRIMVVGNGGIATELVYEIDRCDIVWAVKDASISSVFLDQGAAEFLLPQLNLPDDDKAQSYDKRTKYRMHSDAADAHKDMPYCGTALGPDWHHGLSLHGQLQNAKHVHTEFRVEVKALYRRHELPADLMTLIQPVFGCSNEDEWEMYVQLSNGRVFGCDYVVSATGVVPSVPRFLNTQLELAADGGVLVQGDMQTSISDVYAAGDVCTTGWTPALHWMQMRLWSQARQMGAYAARCMTLEGEASQGQGYTAPTDFCFELFEHVTRFFGYKVVLLGKYNGQGLGSDHELLLRVTKGKEYVKTVMAGGRMHGAVLIGDTDLEETFENLILNQTDLTAYGADLLDAGVDIEDYFD